MKNKFISLFLILGLFASALHASDVTTTVAADYVTSYVFRGEKVAGPSVQPSINVQYGSVYANAWASRPVTHNLSGELDLAAGVNCPLGFDVGTTAYTYPGSAKTTWEPYLGWGTQVDRLKASAYAYRDLTLLTTSYEGKVSIDAVKTGRLSLLAEASLGRVQQPRLAYTYWTAGPTLRYSITKSFSISDSVQFVSSDDRASSPREFWTNRAGFSVSF